MMEFRQRDIVTINFNPKKGEEVGKFRPALIISADDENSILDTIIVMPLSTKLIDNMQPYRVRIKKRGNLKSDSDVLINHIRAISKKRVGKFIERVSKEEFEEIIKNLCKNFI